MTASRLKGLELADLNILHGLPFHHRDPFDRAIISQALAKEIAVVSSDSTFDAYGVERIW